MNWELADRSKKCLICDKEFTMGDQYQTALFLEKDKISQEILNKLNAKKQKIISSFYNTGDRIDYCPECWNKITNEKNYDGSWQGKFANEHKEIRPDAKKINKEEIYDLFKEYYELSQNVSLNEAHIENNGIAYFLAVLLERKNFLSHIRDVIEEKSGANAALYENSRTKEQFTIKYPLLTDETINLYQDKIADLIGLPKRKPALNLTNTENQNPNETK